MEDSKCVFHDDRFEFNVLVRDLRKSGLLTKGYADLMAMTVCSCRQKVAHRSPISEQQVLAAADHVIRSTNDALRTLSPPAAQIVTSGASAAKRHPVTSQGRLVVVISQALNNDVTLLNEEKALAVASRREKTTKKKEGKISPKIYKLIIDKKKKRLPVRCTFSIPVYGGSTYKLFCKDEVGLNFGTLCVQRGCVLEMDSEATAKKMAANEPVTYIKAWGPDDAVLSDVKKLLTTLAREIQEASDASHRIRKQYYEQQRLQRQMSFSTDWSDWSNVTIYDPQVYKEKRAFDFAVQAHQKKKDSKHRKPKPATKRDDGSTYVDGHCLNCSLPFRDFKAADDDDDDDDDKENDVTQCRHHSGYVITEKRWSCCKQLLDPNCPSFKEHAQNGCTVSRHDWRPHKKASRDKKHHADKNMHRQN